MPTLFHPTLDALSDHVAGAPTPRVAAHLTRCARCRESLRFLQSVDAALVDMSAPARPDALLSRILASRAEGHRPSLPTLDAERGERGARRRWPAAAAAAVVFVTLGAALLSRPGDVEAGTTTGTLRFMPAAPPPGARLTVHYRPSALLSAQPHLVLRTRMRSRNGDVQPNQSGIPIVIAARLARQRDGTFVGTFVLPDSVVYAAFVVEDEAGTVIDDAAGRIVDVVVARPDGQPRFDAIEQRAYDMIERDWEGGFATTRRMVALYPDTIRAWAWLRAQQGWLGRERDDTIVAAHRARLAAFERRLAATPRIAPEELGTVFWYAQGIDSAAGARWRERLLREAPTSEFALRERLLDARRTLRRTRDTTAALATLDSLWGTATERLTRMNVVNYGVDIPGRMQAPALMRTWAERFIDGSPDRSLAEQIIATDFAASPLLRREGIDRLRRAIRALDAPPASARRLGETVSRQRRRARRAQGYLLASLGRALAEEGDKTAALDTLLRGAEAGWDLGVFRSVRTIALEQGDSATAARMAAQLLVDPRTDSTYRDSVDQAMRRQLGAVTWQARLDTARRAFVAGMLADSVSHAPANRIRLTDLAGATVDADTLLRGRVAVVAFWSPWCAPALHALSEMNTLARRLAARGMTLVSIIEEPGPMAALRAVLAERRVEGPVYLDTRHEASRAFNQWGTPTFYVLDADGRIRTEAGHNTSELFAVAEALRLERELP